MPTIQEFTGTKTSDMPTAGTITGDELIAVVQGGESVQTTIAATASTGFKISRAAGTATVETDGSITLAPAANGTDGTTGITAASADLGSFGSDTTPLVHFRAGSKQLGSALRLSTATDAQKALEIFVESYSSVIPRIYVDYGGGFYSQAWMELSGDQNVTTGQIYQTSPLGYHLGIRKDVEHGIIVRNAPGMDPTQTTILAAMPDGTEGVVASGTYVYAIDNNGTHKWGSVAYNVNPATLSAASLGLSSGRLRASHLDTEVGADVRVGVVDQGGRLSVTRADSTTAPAAAVVHTATADGGAVLSVSHTNALTGSTSVINANVNTSVRAMGIISQSGNGSAEWTAAINGTATGDPFCRWTINNTAVSFTAGIDNSDFDKFKICRDGYLAGSDVLSVDSTLAVTLAMPPVLPIKADSSAGSRTIYLGSDHGNELCFKDANGAVRAVPGVIATNTTSVSSSNSADTDAFAHTFPAGVWAADGDTAAIYIDGTFATSGSTDKRVQYSLGGSVLFDSGTLTASTATTWTLTGRLTRTNSTRLRGTFRFSTDNGGTSILVKVLPTNFTFTLSSSLAGKVVLKQTTAAADTLFDYGVVEWVPAA